MTAELINKTRYFQKLDSTNLEALRRIKMKKFCPCLIIAQEQSQGRGRYGRIWFAPKGNLYFSYTEHINRPIQQQPLIAAVAVASILKQFIKTAKVTLKYPNDVLVDGQKICGILVDRLEPYYVVGVGINVAVSPLIQNYETTYVHHYNKRVSVGLLLRCFLKRYLALSTQNFEAILTQWLASCGHMNEHIKLTNGTAGIFKGLDKEGFPILEKTQSILEVIQ